MHLFEDRELIPKTNKDGEAHKLLIELEQKAFAES